MGFTLVETLFAVLLFVLISGALYFSVSIGIKTVERQKTNFEIFQELRICTREMKRDLRSFFYAEDIELEAFDGGVGSLSIISYKPEGLCKISYYQEGNDFFRSKQKLSFKKTGDDKKETQLAEAQTYRLACLLRKVEFEYLDENKDWQGSWDKDEEYPAAVKVIFFFEDALNEYDGYKFENVISVALGKKIFADKNE